MGLLGRSNDSRRLAERIRARRLITVTGPGGIGKSALARDVARNIVSDYERGFVEVDLTRVDYGNAVAGALASQLGYPDLATLTQTPEPRSVLILVDNCEHVLDQAAVVISELVESWPAATVLTTSRSPLDLPHESIVALGPLAVPGPEALDLDAAAVQLLFERASDHGVDLDPGADGRLAADVVQRLDGIPLAIELAAAQLRTMTLAEMADNLTTHTHALARPRFRGRPQHRSVTELIDWSYSLLDSDLAHHLDSLAVFAGPFTASMAAAVTTPDATSPEEARRWLSELVNSSLVERATGVDGGWFRLLHPVRAVARQRLAGSGRERDVENRYIDHIVEMAVGIIARSSTGWHSSLITDLLALFDNISAALTWALDHDDDGHRAHLLMAVLWGVIHQAHTPEVARLGEAVLARWPEHRGPTWADAVATVATCRNLLGDPDGALALARSAFEEGFSSPTATATLHRVVAQSHRARSEVDEAHHHFRVGAEAAETAALPGMAMELWTDYGALTAELGDVAAGLAAIDTAIERGRKAGAQINVAWSLAARGHALALAHRRSTWRPSDRADPADRDDPADRADLADDPASLLTRAGQALEEAVTLSRSIKYPAGTVCGLRGLAEVKLASDDRRGAAQALLEVLATLQASGNLTELRLVLDGAVQVLASVPGTSWVDLAATAESLPITNVATPLTVGVPDVSGSPGRGLSRREAFLLARRELTQLVADSEPASDFEITHDVEPNAWIDEGDVWRVDYAGQTIRLRQSKGLADLARLLAAPGRELHVLDLAGATGTEQSGLSTIDEEARRAYEGRVRELQADLEAAEADNDMGQVERLQVELDAVVDQLAAGLGLAGRTRTTGGDAERARSAVTRRIRDAISRITAEHDTLGRHLDGAIRTGVFCSYQPEIDPGWTVSRH